MFSSLKSAAALSAILLATSISVAQAQNASSGEVQTIIVTGSRIPVSPLSTTQPVIGLDQAAIETAGLSSTADLLQRLPLAGGGLNAKFNNSGNLGNPP